VTDSVDSRRRLALIGQLVWSEKYGLETDSEVRTAHQRRKSKAGYTLPRSNMHASKICTSYSCPTAKLGFLQSFAP
jgi:hypothetical protein